MSRVGKKEIQIPAGVNIEISPKNLVTVKGPKGSLTQQLESEIQVKIEGGVLQCERPTEQKRHKALHGLTRALINNMVVGVTDGFSRKLEIVGVGFKAVCDKNVLELNLGYSHSIFFALPEEVLVNAVMEKGKNPIVSIEGIDKQLVGQIVAKIKSLRQVEPYKGKGIREVGEVIRRKAGKTAAKK
jgi:large subunit ribosomal protein L6